MMMTTLRTSIFVIAMLLFSTGAHGELEKDTEVVRSGFVHGKLPKNSSDFQNNGTNSSQNERKVRTSTRHTRNRGGKGKGKGYIIPDTEPEEEMIEKEGGSGRAECTNKRLVHEEHYYYYECGECGGSTIADDNDYYDESSRNTPTASPTSTSTNGKGKAGGKGKYSRKYSRK